MKTEKYRRHVLITGAARRIGRAIALAMASHGWIVTLHCHQSVTAAEDTLASLPSGEHQLAVADLANPETPNRLVKDALMAVGRLDCIVNNASIFEMDDIESLSAASLQRHHAINVMAPTLLAKALYEEIGAVSHPASVVHVLDQKISNPNPDYLSYTLSKLALAASIRTMAMALAPRVRLNAVAPGVTMQSVDQTEAGFAASHQIAALGRSSTPNDIAAAVRWLAEADAVTGQTLIVDGGQHLVPTGRDVLFVTEKVTS